MNQQLKVSGFIPARMASSRFPGKPLASICGISMVEHVYRRCKLSKAIDELYIATCDDEILSAAKEFGANAVMTKDTHERCTDRVAEAYINVKCEAEIVVVIQGDEPLVRPEMIDLAVEPLLGENGREIFCTNLTGEILEIQDAEDPNEVKVVFNNKMEALYFSREPIPSRKKGGTRNAWKQICVMPFWQDNLKKFNELEPTPLEEAESVDMMRVLEHGFRLQLVESPFQVLSVDTPEDLRKAEAIMKKDDLFNMYK